MINLDKLADYIIDNPRKVLVVSLLFLAICISSIGYRYMLTGEPVERSIDFKSGTQLVLEYKGNLDIGQATARVHELYGTSAKIRVLGGITNTVVIDTDKQVNMDDIDRMAKSLNIEITGRSLQSIGSTVGQEFWGQALTAIFLAFVAMSVVVFITFRSAVPSLAVILAGFSDIVTAVAGMNLFGIQLSIATLAGLLILIGYSVDTDILLSTRVLKRKEEGDVRSRIKSSMKTGLMMTLASIVAVVVLLLISSSPTLDDIALVMIIGLVADMPYTWMQNVSILRIYTEREGK